MGEHVDALLGEALDGRLDQRRQHRVDGHLAACDRCSSLFADMAAAVEAVRGLPAVRMPVPVHLPSGSPGAAPWRPRLAWPIVGMVGATGMAAAVAIALATHGGNGPTQNGLSARTDRGAASAAAVAGAGAPGPAVGGPANAEAPASPPAPDVRAFDSGLANQATATVPSRPGEILVVGTQQRTYPAGASVSVVARLVSLQGNTSVTQVPAGAAPAAGATAGDRSLSIQAVVAGQRTAAPSIGGAAASASSPTTARSGTAGGSGPPAVSVAPAFLPVAGPTSDGTYVVALPPGLAPGTVVTVVASVPDPAGRAPLETAITIEIA